MKLLHVASVSVARRRSSRLLLLGILASMLVSCAHQPAGETVGASASPGPSSSLAPKMAEQVLDAQLSANGIGWALNAAGSLVVTSDAGTSWRLLAVPLTPSAVASANHRFVLAALGGAT